MKKRFVAGGLALVLVGFVLFFREGVILQTFGIPWEAPWTERVEVEDRTEWVDTNGNGITDQ